MKEASWCGERKEMIDGEKWKEIKNIMMKDSCEKAEEVAVRCGVREELVLKRFVTVIMDERGGVV